MPGVRTAMAIAGVSLLSAGCLSVRSPDLFLLTRTGASGTLTLLVNDGGTIKCDNGPAKPLPDKLLIQARALASQLEADAKDHLRIRSSAKSVNRYSIKLQNGTVVFPDTAGRRRSEFAQIELWTVQAAQGPCGLSG